MNVVDVLSPVSGHAAVKHGRSLRVPLPIFHERLDHARGFHAPSHDQRVVCGDDRVTVTVVVDRGTARQMLRVGKRVRTQVGQQAMWTPRG